MLFFSRRPCPSSPRPRSDDDGFSLAEVMVTMGIMSVLMVLFTGAILQVYRTVNATETLSEAQAQLGRAFQTFDRQLRYASWVSAPGTFGGATYVEFAGPQLTDCYQLRLEPGPAGSTDKGVLQLLNWTAGSPPAAGTRGRTIASQIVTTGVDPYFDRQSVGAAPYASTGVGQDFTTAFQRLRIRLTTRSGAGTAQIDTTFTALNTSDQTPATNACSEGRPS
ncbi:prepilin-type N-terminal cleavage/methylation domain-containing protein [Symbioplanes lichenis]|uniref:prepilin-type N-terminal cleavage/methylation domain-containing protein n=1 Tax=Symbioplanes lichenis TaxID=1629072 RepID=UPI002739444C|nr:prepilin-type N-terminal cleavage/methylation domain-containing protein [Actinoplanes lichenis]